MPLCAQDRTDPSLRPARKFTSSIRLTVFTLSDQGASIEIGRTPGTLSIPGNRRWFVKPPHLGKQEIKRLAEEIRRQEIPGLSLAGLDVREETLVTLTGLDQLTFLDLTDCWHLTDAGLRPLSTLTNLRRLKLHGCNNIGNAGLAHLRGLTQIRELDIWGCCPLTGSGLAHLSQMARLNHLRLTSHSTGAGLAHLKRLPIRTLDLSRWGWLTNKGLGSLRALRQLEVLNLNGCESLSDPVLAHIGTLTTLIRLDISDSNITNHGLKQLDRLVNLREIHLPEGVVRDDGLIHLSRMTALRQLSLRRCRGVTDKGINLILALTELRRLDLSRCVSITDRGLLLLTGLSALRELDLRGCRLLTNKGIERLRARMPRFQIHHGAESPPPEK